MAQTSYKLFDKYVFRTPLLSFDIKNCFLESINADYFNEAIYLASPELYQEKLKPYLKSIEQQKLMVTMNKYFSRSFYRCTPFGLFAGCSVGYWGDVNNIELAPLAQYKRHTRLDMNFICELIQAIENDVEIRQKLMYFPNDSAYSIGKSIRYTEYFLKKNKRIHKLSNVEKNIYIDKIFTVARNGATIKELANSIADEEITYDEAENFVTNIIDYQILKSQIQPSTTGRDPLTELINNLVTIKDEKYLRTLCRIQSMLHIIDEKPIGLSINEYSLIADLIKQTGVSYDVKFLFQVDMFKPVKFAELSGSIIKDLNELISFLNYIDVKPIETNLSHFINAFYERYEDQEVSLSVALDTELGLGYPIESGNAGDINILVDDLIIGNNKSTNPKISLNGTDIVLLRKYIEAAKTNQGIVYLTKDDFINGNNSFSDLPKTMSIMCSILQNEDNTLHFHIKSVGSNGGNLLGRFCHVDEDIHHLVKDVALKEQELDTDVIIAEISHLPESRIGNILHRPTLRDYEIHYLAKSGVDISHQISVSDLMISVRNRRIILTSKSLGKEIVPRLTNAHNYINNSMPIYRFLCDMQSQGIRNGLSFSWGQIFNYLYYTPRLQYKNHIIAPEKWSIDVNEIQDFDKCDDITLMNKINDLRYKLNLPKTVVIPEGDNELFIDLECQLSVRVMLSTIKSKQKLIMIESLFSENNVFIKGIEGRYTNEFIIPLYKN